MYTQGMVWHVKIVANQCSWYALVYIIIANLYPGMSWRVECGWTVTSLQTQIFWSAKMYPEQSLVCENHSKNRYFAVLDMIRLLHNAFKIQDRLKNLVVFLTTQIGRNSIPFYLWGVLEIALRTRAPCDHSPKQKVPITLGNGNKLTQNTSCHKPCKY